MYVGALPTMLSVQTVNSCFIVIYPTLVSRIWQNFTQTVTLHNSRKLICLFFRRWRSGWVSTSCIAWCRGARSFAGWCCGSSVWRSRGSAPSAPSPPNKTCTTASAKRWVSRNVGISVLTCQPLTIIDANSSPFGENSPFEIKIGHLQDSCRSDNIFFCGGVCSEW